MASGERWSLALLGCWVQSGALDAGFQVCLGAVRQQFRTLWVETLGLISADADRYSWISIMRPLRRNCKLVCQVGYNSELKKNPKNSSKDKKSFVNAWRTEDYFLPNATIELAGRLG